MILDLTLEERLLPVVFYIHGGGFTGGGAKWIEPHILLDEDIVLVTIQYRLGIFGFLSLECPEYSGNMGLKDQLLALQWVNENIIHFGGDKNNVTIYGHSAGATSVNYHLLSPSAQGLFQRAIVTGGSVYNHFALASSPRLQLQFLTNRTAAPVFNATVQHLTANHDKLVSWLKEAKSHDILFHTFKPLFGKEGEEKDHIILWAPIIERKRTLTSLTGFNNIKPEISLHIFQNEMLYNHFYLNLLTIITVNPIMWTHCSDIHLR